MLTENPIARFELNRMQRKFSLHGASYWFRLVAYFCILLVAAIPLFIYIGEPELFVLGFMLIVIAPAQLILVLRTLMQAGESTLLQRQTGMWDTLLITGMSARQIISGKRDAVVQAMWAEWMLLAIARFGLAYGLALYLDRGSYFLCLRQFLDAFCYESYARYLYPNIVEIMVALVTVIVIARLQLHLVGLIGIGSSLLPTKNRTLGWLIAVLLWLAITGSAFGGVIVLDQMRELFQCTHRGSFCETFIENLPESDEDENFRITHNGSYAILLTDFRRLTDISLVSMSALIDSGTLLASFIMRPYFVLNFTTLLRGLLCFGGAFLGYRLINWLMFNIARRLAVSQGALPEPKRKGDLIRFLKRQIGFT